MAWSGDGVTISVRFRIISGSSNTANQGRSTNPFTGMKLPDEVIALGVTRTAKPITDSSISNNAPTTSSSSIVNSVAQGNEQSRTTRVQPTGELNVTTNATDSSQTQTDMPVANTGAANAEPQEQTP